MVEYPYGGCSWNGFAYSLVLLSGGCQAWFSLRRSAWVWGCPRRRTSCISGWVCAYPDAFSLIVTEGNTTSEQISRPQNHLRSHSTQPKSQSIQIPPYSIHLSKWLSFHFYHFFLVFPLQFVDLIRSNHSSYLNQQRTFLRFFFSILC